MKLINKKTGEIIVTTGIMLPEPNQTNYRSLAELNEEWEDYEESKPQVAYYIDRDGKIVSYKPNDFYPKRVFDKEQNEEIGNYFETKEEAEKAVKKLKAWKRLEGWGFKFCGEGTKMGTIEYSIARPPLTGEGYWTDEVHKCFDLLFGGEDDERRIK